ncbi:MAG: biopolymer transporter ExbD [Desulfurobacteriaceae bacterium]
MQIRDKRKKIIVDINLSPILDLSLMLVIFLAVTTEFISGGEIKVQVPKGGSGIHSQEEVVKIVIDKWGKIYYQGKTYQDPAKVAALLPKNKRIYIKADKEVPYQFVFTMLDALRKFGIQKVSLVGQRID